MFFVWKVDPEGDFLLKVDGEYFGMVCPHHLPKYALVVRDWGEYQASFPTVEEARSHLEQVARATKAASDAYTESMSAVRG